VSLILEGVTKRFGDLRVLEDFSMVFPENKVSVLLGPSGSGKTTVLNLLAGLLEPCAGRILVGGRPAGEVRVSYLFQDPRLLPWMTVEKNLDFVLSPTLAREERRSRIKTCLEQVSLAAAAGRYPAELSGGMARRAAMARAFLFESEALLMDEPFQGLDLPLKFQLIRSFEDALGRDLKTTLFVTHDMEEALLLGDEIHVLSRPPAVVRLSLSHPVPRRDRYPGHEGFSALERMLFEALQG
jgi:NitT/TauT family transport system ATP-binding protein